MAHMKISKLVIICLVLGMCLGAAAALGVGYVQALDQRVSNIERFLTTAGR